jgi:hypothetical protein
MTRKTLTLLLLIATECSSEAGIRTKLSHAMDANQIQDHKPVEHSFESRLNNECDLLSPLVIEVPGVAWVSEAKLTELFSERRDPQTTDAATASVTIILEGYSGGWYPPDTAGLIGSGIVALFGPHSQQKAGIFILVAQWHCPKASAPVSQPVIEQPPRL